MSKKPLISFDYAIKYLLKDKGDYEIVEGFISAILTAHGYNPVKISALLDGESSKESRPLKKSIADLIVEDTKGEKYIVEIERDYTIDFVNKACFNTSRLIVDSISESEDYSTIKKVFHISILYFSLSSMNEPLYHAKTVIQNIDNKHPLDLKLGDLRGKVYELVKIFPEYFIISIPAFDDVVRNEMDEWLYVMKHDKVGEDFKSPYMKKVEDRLNVLKMTDEEKDGYYSFMKEKLTQRDSLRGAKEEGMAEGEAKGEAKGRMKGIAEGEAKSKITIAKNLLTYGMKVEEISNITGLTNQEVKEIENSK